VHAVVGAKHVSRFEHCCQAYEKEKKQRDVAFKKKKIRRERRSKKKTFRTKQRTPGKRENARETNVAGSALFMRER
jgi:hypothetical protein